MSSFDAPYDRLQALPRSVWLPTLTAAVGQRARRLDDVRVWLAALNAGALPATDADFGDAHAAAALRRVVGALNLPGFTRATPALAEQVLRTMLWHLDRALNLEPRLTRDDAIAHVAQEFEQSWQLELHGLQDDLALLRDLSGGAHLPWGELRGRLRSREWHEARRAADRLALLPELTALLQRLGRREFSPRADRAPAPQATAQRVPLRAVPTRLPGAPGEITGIRFDSRIEHMLPSEAILLRHPVGKRLWRARQAEGRLLAHETEAVVIDWRPDPHGRVNDNAAAAPLSQALERGPFVLCLDTSGSMAGAPENVAKAVAIAALREAHASGRACKLLAFGGPDELIERDLLAPRSEHARPAPRGGSSCPAEPDQLDGDLNATLDLMAQSFDGGTDVQTPIERAIDVMHDAAWQGADLLIVSDGEFGCVRATLDKLDRARDELGLHVQGVLVGDRETMGLLEVCDDIHWVRDWRRHADGSTDAQATSPVHSKSLTALYFPNALSPQAARHSAADSGAVRR
jgi:uncharacterized protein with von Willebrand factor type A (vWA) domain